MLSAAERRQKQAGFVRERYPRSGTLRGGRSFDVRLMHRADRDAVLAFARALPTDDLLYLRSDITDAGVVDGWVNDIERLNIVTILALENGKIIGEASLLQSGAGWTRHRGDIRMIVGPQARGEGWATTWPKRSSSSPSCSACASSPRRCRTTSWARSRSSAVSASSPWRCCPGFVVDREGAERDLLVMAYDVTARGAPASAQESGR